jgi:hypothetical protein
MTCYVLKMSIVYNGALIWRGLGILIAVYVFRE